MTATPTIAAAVFAALLCSAMLPSAGVRPQETAPPLRGRPRAGWPAWPVTRRQSAEPAAIAAWADDIGRSIRHGSTLRAAIGSVVPDDHRLAEHSAVLRHLLDRGDGVREACDTWATHTTRLGVAGADLLTAFATVLAAAATLGGSAAAPIDRFAVAMRQRVSDDLERDANSAQARLSARVLTAVPLGVLVLLLVADREVRSVVTEPTGGAVVATGLALNALGARWMRHIARPGGHR